MSLFNKLAEDIKKVLIPEEIAEKILLAMRNGFERKGARKSYVDASSDYIEVMNRLGLIEPTPEEFGTIRPIPGFPLTKKAREIYYKAREERF